MKNSLNACGLPESRALTLVLCLSAAWIPLGHDLGAAQAGENKTIKVLKSEPRAGKLPFGVKVFVDDGSCPPGQIKQMYRASAAVSREKKCITWKSAKPSQMLKKEPGKGKIKSGVIVLVDDGTCPAGKIKQVTGGGSSQGRKRACIAKP